MRTVVAAVVVALALVTTACTAPPVPDPPSTGPSTATASATPTPTPTSSPTPTTAAPADAIVVGTSQLSVTRDGETVTVDWSDGPAVLSLVRDITGEDPAGDRVPPYHGMDFELTQYQFTGIQVSQDGDAEPRGSILVRASVAGIPVT